MPASEGLKSFVQKGYSVVIQLTSSLRKTLLGFTMSVFYNAAGFSIRCTSIMKTNSGLLSYSRESFFFSFWGPKEASKVQKYHFLPSRMQYFLLMPKTLVCLFNLNSVLSIARTRF